MDDLRHRALFIAEETAPLGRVMRLRLRVSVDILITLLLALLALAATAAYQLLVHRPFGRRPAWR